MDLYLLFFIHPGTRRVIVSRITANPDNAWMKQQARKVIGVIMVSDDLNAIHKYFNNLQP